MKIEINCDCQRIFWQKLVRGPIYLGKRCNDMVAVIDKNKKQPPNRSFSATEIGVMAIAATIAVSVGADRATDGAISGATSDTLGITSSNEKLPQVGDVIWSLTQDGKSFVALKIEKGAKTSQVRVVNIPEDISVVDSANLLTLLNSNEAPFVSAALARLNGDSAPLQQLAAAIDPQTIEEKTRQALVEPTTEEPHRAQRAAAAQAVAAANSKPVLVTDGKNYTLDVPNEKFRPMTPEEIKRVDKACDAKGPGINNTEICLAAEQGVSGAATAKFVDVQSATAKPKKFEPRKNRRGGEPKGRRVPVTAPGYDDGVYNPETGEVERE